MSTTWGQNSWGDNSWQSNTVTITPTGQSSTSSLGSIDAFPATGWGGLSWGTNNFGDLENLNLDVSGFGLTSSVGSIEAYNEIGWVMMVGVKKLGAEQMMQQQN